MITLIAHMKNVICLWVWKFYYLFSGRGLTDGTSLARSAPTAERSPMLSNRERLRLSFENDKARHARFRGEKYVSSVFVFSDLSFTVFWFPNCKLQAAIYIACFNVHTCVLTFRQWTLWWQLTFWRRNYFLNFSTLCI